jgi:hypothetical protein
MARTRVEKRKEKTVHRNKSGKDSPKSNGSPLSLLWTGEESFQFVPCSDLAQERNGKEELAPMVGSLAHIVITQTERQGNVAITIIISREGAHSQFM